MDWWVDGHYIHAPNAHAAALEVEGLYDHIPRIVRPWTTQDSEEYL